ncbi:unnamed protein product, partial [Amoebophrya sp. A25]|eukprot:GSA25T00021910001.1
MNEVRAAARMSVEQSGCRALWAVYQHIMRSCVLLASKRAVDSVLNLAFRDGPKNFQLRPLALSSSMGSTSM